MVLLWLILWFFNEADGGGVGMLVASHESLILHPVDCTIATWWDRNFAIFVLYCADLVR